MLVLLLAYIGGALTIVSPCILPVLPFVFARSDRPFVQSGLPLLAGMALTFAAVATLAAFAGGWAVAANQYGRYAAIALLGLFGITLLFPELADRLTRPLVALGGRLSMTASGKVASPRTAIWSSLLLGVATGLLWAPCAGPILGLILTGAALQGASATTTLALLAYALGAATSLALALLIGGRVFAAMKRSLGVGEWIRRGIGALVLAAVVTIAMGVDTGFLTQLSSAGTNTLEQSLIDHIQGTASEPTTVEASSTADELAIEGPSPGFGGATQWLNSSPLTTAGLKGKVVLVDFWTYSCINCIRALPYVKAWADKYRDHGLVVIGVHTPEFAFEKDAGNVTAAIVQLGVDYPVAMDNDFAVWRAFKNQYWPAHFFVDAKGDIRQHHFGEGSYDDSERIIQQLLIEAGNTNVPTGLVDVSSGGAQAGADLADLKSPETYLGYGRGQNFVSPGGAVRDQSHIYEPGTPALNQWGYSGAWTIGTESSALDAAGGGITYRFHARDIHLVLGPSDDDRPIRFKVTIDGQSPGDDHGADTDAAGNGTVTSQRLYQMVRQTGAVMDRTFEITFLDPGVHAYTFTFG